MALQHVADSGFDARGVAWQPRSTLQNRATTDRMDSVWMLLALALAAAIGYLVFLQ